jgi:hypothetical protein
VGVFLLELKGRGGKELGPLLLFNPLCLRRLKLNAIKAFTFEIAVQGCISD